MLKKEELKAIKTGRKETINKHKKTLKKLE